MVLGVKEPQPQEVGLLKEGQTLFTYLHLAPAPELTRGCLSALPQEVIEEMRDAVITADLDQLLAKIDDVEALDPGIALGLRRLAEGFQYQKLLDLLSTGTSVEFAKA